jgi:molybdenum cofactor cytidylyltransferase
MIFAALVLAAGSARRFGSDKLSAPFAGEPLVLHAIRAARAAPVERVIVVAHPTLDLAAATGVEVVRLASGALSQSLRAGVAAVGEVDGVFVFLGDMPLVPHGAATRLAALLGSHYAAMPLHAGKPGHPVLLSRAAFADVARAEGDAGLGKLLRTRDDVAFDACADPFIHADVDRPADLAALVEGAPSAR